MPLAGHDTDNLRPLLLRHGISTPMPLAGHDDWRTVLIGQGGISTPMPLAGHDRIQH